MNGGRMTTTRFAIAAVATAMMSSTAAFAADLGGNCCADLEERIAELEATTIKKGNRKVSLTISGHVNAGVLYWNDGTQNDVYFGDPANGSSRFRFVGTAKIMPKLSAGFLYEFNAFTNSLGNSSNQLNGGNGLGSSGAPQSASLGGTAYAGCGNAVGASTISSTNSAGCPVLRDATVWLRHDQLGMIKVGHGSTATDNLTLIDVGNMGIIGTSDVGLHVGGFILRGKNGTLANSTALNWNAAIRGHESFDTFRRDHVLYETPTLMGFSMSAAIANDNFWDVALRYAGEFSGIRVAAGFGYQEDTGFNGPFQQGGNATLTATQKAGGLCGSGASTNCDVKTREWKGSMSGLHVQSGLFLTAAYADRNLGGNNNNNTGTSPGGTPAGVSTAYTGPDATMLWLAAGITKNFFGLGNTTLFGEWGEHKGGLAQVAFLGGVSQNPNGFAACINGSPTTGGTTGGTNCKSTVTSWGLAAVQYIDAAAMEVYLGYKNYGLDTNGFTGVNASLNKSQGGVHDIQAIMMGTKINF